MAEPRLVLASASPRRLDLLRLAGLAPAVVVADVDETPRPGEASDDYVQRLARDKALAVAADGAVVVAADTAVVLDGEILGKPADPLAARALLQRLGGRVHTVSTGVAVRATGGAIACEVVTTRVEFAPLRADVITDYVASGEPLDKAGAYAIQGRAAAFVRRIEGSWTNVVGLPLVETLELLRGAGLDA